MKQHLRNSTYLELQCEINVCKEKTKQCRETEHCFKSFETFCLNLPVSVCTCFTYYISYLINDSHAFANISLLYTFPVFLFGFPEMFWHCQGFTCVLKFLLSCILCHFTHFSLHTVAVCPALISFTCALLTCAPLSLLIVFPRVPLSWYLAVFQVLFRSFHAYYLLVSLDYSHVGNVQLLGLLLLVWVIYLPSHTVSLLFVYIEPLSFASRVESHSLRSLLGTSSERGGKALRVFPQQNTLNDECCKYSKPKLE